jgi:hypothetical protein
MLKAYQGSGIANIDLGYEAPSRTRMRMWLFCEDDGIESYSSQVSIRSSRRDSVAKAFLTELEAQLSTDGGHKKPGRKKNGRNRNTKDNVFKIAEEREKMLQERNQVPNKTKTIRGLDHSESLLKKYAPELDKRWDDKNYHFKETDFIERSA